MSIESVREFLAQHAPDVPIIDQGRSTATVAEAAETLGVAPGQIAKTPSLRIGHARGVPVAPGAAGGGARRAGAGASEALGGAGGQIAKTLSVRIGEAVVLIVARGDARLDNRK